MVKVDKPGRSRFVREHAGAMVPSKSGSTPNMSSNIKVVVRVRPFNEKEMEHHHRVVVDVVDEQMLVFDPKEETRPFFFQGVQQPNKNFLKRANKELKFVFDHICGQDASNKDVFEKTTKDMLGFLMEGYNCSVFVYGATGAGKTFTMIGNEQCPGITYLTMEHLFYTIDSFQKDREFDIAVSYLEIYNENVYDLLKTTKTSLQLREDAKYGVMVAGLTLHKISTARELLNMLENGNRNRTQHPTDANAESSRSHAVFQVYVTMRLRTSSERRLVKLSMIDLAGSERASATGCRGMRFKEGANINRSLLALGNCINRLADGGAYIPYRDSKLTRLLKDSLGGNCRTVMIANVAPSISGYEDTYNTLKYASRASQIRHTVSKSAMDGESRVSDYVRMVNELKKKIKELEAKLSLSSLPGPAQNTEESRKKIKDLEMKLALKEKDEIKLALKEKENETLKKNIKELESKAFVVRQDSANNEIESDWRHRIEAAEKALAASESKLLELMSRQRVLALRQRLRAKAHTRVAELAHRASTEAMEQTCSEDIPRQERASEHYTRHAAALHSKVRVAHASYTNYKEKLRFLTQTAVTECSTLKDLVAIVWLKSEQRVSKASDELRQKLLIILNDEINAATEFMFDATAMLRKLYLTLKGYDKVTPNLASEYQQILRKAKSGRGITWSDDDEQSEVDLHFNFFINIDPENPAPAPIIPLAKREDTELYSTEEITDSDATETENVDPKPTKRRGTPIKLANNETILIDDSLEHLDVTQNLSSSKKIKREPGNDVENSHGFISANDLNSTFVLAGKMEAMDKQNFKNVSVKMEPKRILSDTTNTLQRQINFNDRGVPSGPRVLKPVVGRAIPFRRPPALGTTGPAAPRAGFGSSLSRDGTPLSRNIQETGRRTYLTERSVGFKAVRARDRYNNHPYSRPNNK